MRRETRRYYESTREVEGVGERAARSADEVRVSYKTYPRFPALELDVSLPDPRTAEWPVPRLSTEDATARERMSFRELSDILYGSAGMAPEGLDAASPGRRVHRMYPSAGGLFPVEVYLFSSDVPSLPDGLHHYDVKHDVLEQLLAQDVRADVASIAGDQVVEGGSAIVCLTGVLSRSEPAFGAHAYRLALIEAGHIAQSMRVLAAHMGRRCEVIPVFDSERLEAVLDLTGDEIPLCLVELR